METDKICKQYFDMHKALLKENQFNRKVELNVKISNFKKFYNINLSDKDLDIEVFMKDKMIGIIHSIHAKKDKNLECRFLGYKYEIIKH